MNLIDKKDLRNLQIRKLTEFGKTQQKQLEDEILKEKLLKSRLLHQVENVGISISMALEYEPVNLELVAPLKVIVEFFNVIDVSNCI